MLTFPTGATSWLAEHHLFNPHLLKLSGQVLSSLPATLLPEFGATCCPSFRHYFTGAEPDMSAKLMDAIYQTGAECDMLSQLTGHRVCLPMLQFFRQVVHIYVDLHINSTHYYWSKYMSDQSLSIIWSKEFQMKVYLTLRKESDIVLGNWPYSPSKYSLYCFTDLCPVNNAGTFKKAMNCPGHL